MTVNGYDVVRMVRNLREPDVTPKTAARAADLMDELAEELAGTREELGDLNSLLDAVMNESITCEEVLHLARHLHACMDEVVKSLQLLAAGADGVVLPAGSAGAFRTLADYIERPPSMAATKAGITLRRAADQIDPTNEPDLATVEGWATVLDGDDTVSWCDMPKPVTTAQRSALVAAWSDMLAHRHPVSATKLAMVLAASFEDASGFEA